jgi:C-terminal processing protease CtpA/Prc
MNSIARERRRSLRNISKLVLTKHINITGVDLVAWAGRLEEKSGVLIQAESETFEEDVRAFLRELGTSHTAFYSHTPTRFPPQHTINATLSLARGRDQQWMFVDVFEGGPAAEAGIAPGDLLWAIGGRECTRETAPQFAIGAEQRLTISGPNRRDRTDVVVSVPMRRATKARPPMVEPKAFTFRELDADTALLRIVYFPGAFGLRFGREIATLMGAIRNSGYRHLVLDLRGNIGGSLGFARVAGFLCPYSVPIGHSLTPQRLRTGYKVEDLPREVMPSNVWELLSALARYSVKDKSLMLMTPAPGPQPFHGRIVVLVNEWTNSAGEMLAAFASEQAGAQVIGQRTRGNVLGAANFSVGGGYWLRLPVFGWYTSRGCSLEGKGLSPDVNVPAESLTNGVDDQLEAARRVLKTVAY